MIRRGYIWSAETEKGEWARATAYTRTWFPVNEGEMYDDILTRAAEYFVCSVDEVKITAFGRL